MFIVSEVTHAILFSRYLIFYLDINQMNLVNLDTWFNYTDKSIKGWIEIIGVRSNVKWPEQTKLKPQFLPGIGLSTQIYVLAFNHPIIYLTFVLSSLHKVVFWLRTRNGKAHGWYHAE